MSCSKSHIKFVVAALFGLLFSDGYAQQEWMFNQYLFNTYDINAAFAGSYNDIAFAARYRNQWVGIDGAPVSQSLSVNAPWNKSIGVGLRFFNETIGARDRQSVKASFAYKLPLNKGKLSFAISPGFVNENFHLEELSVIHPDDPNIYNEKASAVSFDFASIYISDKTLIGIEIQNLNAPQMRDSYEDSKLQRHYVFTASQAFPVKKKNVFKPSMLIRYDEKAELSAEANVSYFYNNLFWIGGGYRLGYGLIFYTEWNIGEHLRFGYSYDYPTNILKGQQNGSHEIFLGCHLNMKGAKPKSLRYFN